MLSSFINGDEEGAQALADQASAAIDNFMVTGDLSTEQLLWAAYIAEEGETMVVCSNRELRTGHFDAEIQSLIPAGGMF